MPTPVPPSRPFIDIDQIRIRKLDGPSNWYTWKREILIIPQGTDSDEIVSGVETSPTDPALHLLWTLKNKRAYALMWACTEPNHHYLFSGTILGSVAFQKLKAQFEGTTFGRRVFLRESLWKTIHDPSFPVDVYIQKILQIREQLSDIGVTIDDTEINNLILLNLDSTFDDTRKSLLSQSEELSLETIKRTLFVVEIIKNNSSKKALPVSTRFPSSQDQKPPAQSLMWPGLLTSPDKYFRWCNPLRDTDCHCCGLPGHTAARCVHNMPQNVKDWIHNQPKDASHGETSRNYFTF